MDWLAESQLFEPTTTNFGVQKEVPRAARNCGAATDRFWPEVASRLIYGTISAVDPKQTVVFRYNRLLTTPMPITIRNYTDNSDGDEIAFLCEDEWHLREQLQELGAWLVSHADELPAGDYIADIGFSPRDNAAGGGTVLSADSLKAMAAKGMSLELSEYPPFG